MTCIKAQSMITPFINDKLSIKELEEFLDHIASCPNCKEELEFYYTLLTAMKQLDEDRNLSDDYKEELSGRLKAAQEKIIHFKYTYYRKKTILILFIILLAFLLGIHYAEKGIEIIMEEKKSDFHLRRVYFDERYEILDQQLQDFLRQQGYDKITPAPPVE